MKKVISEFRINSNVLFYKHKEEIAYSLTEEFPDWVTNSLSFNLINKRLKRFIVLEHNRIAVVGEDVQNEHNFFEIISKVLQFYNEKLKIERVYRSGIRFQIAEKTPLKFYELVKLFQRKFYPDTDEIREIFAKDFSDVAFSGVIEKEACKFQFGTGPTHKNEIFIKMDFKFPVNVEEDMSDVMLYIDIDGFKENLNIEELLTIIPTIRSENHKMSENISKLFNT